MLMSLRLIRSDLASRPCQRSLCVYLYQLAFNLKVMGGFYSFLLTFRTLFSEWFQRVKNQSQDSFMRCYTQTLVLKMLNFYPRYLTLGVFVWYKG